jgi:hypothetical protein
VDEMNVNWLAILTSSVFAMILGFIWYSPSVFEKQWLKLSGLTRKEIKISKDKMPMVFGGQFVAAVVEVWVLAMFVNFSGANDIVTGAIIGLWIWLGFIATIGVGDMLFNKKPLQLVVINTGYQLVFLLISGALLASWG